jgi:Phage capsid family.
MSKGLKNHVAALVAAANNIRKYGDENGKRQITFRELLETRFPDSKVEHLLSEIGISGSTTLEDAWAKGDEAKNLVAEMIVTAIAKGMGQAQSSMSIITQSRDTYITPEVILTPIMTGAIQGAFYDRLVATSEPVPSDSVTVPKIEISDARMEKGTELSKANRGKVTTGKKKVSFEKTQKALEISYEALRRHSLNFIQIYFEHLGALMASDLNRDLVTISINGDQVDGSESAAVIGIKDTNAGFKYRDVVRGFVRMGLMGQTPDAIVTSERMAEEWLDMPEVKNRQTGNAVMNLRLQTPIPADLPIYIAPNMPDTQFELVNTATAFAQLVEQALMIETDKVINGQFHEAVASAYIGFMNILRHSRLIIDTSLQINFGTGANYFPDWFKPL